MWVEEIVDTGLGGDLDRNGIVPRDVEGLDGILWFPFLHGGFGHLQAIEARHSTADGSPHRSAVPGSELAHRSLGGSGVGVMG